MPIAMQDSKIWIERAFSIAGDTNDLYVYNPKIHGGWALIDASEMMVLPSPRDSFQMTFVAGNLYIFGGENADFSPGIDPSAITLDASRLIPTKYFRSVLQ